MAYLCIQPWDREGYVGGRKEKKERAEFPDVLEAVVLVDEVSPGSGRIPGLNTCSSHLNCLAGGCIFEHVLHTANGNVCAPSDKL